MADDKKKDDTPEQKRPKGERANKPEKLPEETEKKIGDRHFRHGQ